MKAKIKAAELEYARFRIYAESEIDLCHEVIQR